MTFNTVDVFGMWHLMDITYDTVTHNAEPISEFQTTFWND